MRTSIPSSGLATRAPAALTAGVLALSAVMPPVALAEQDQEEDGTVAVTQSNGNGADQGASFDPGGGASQLPDAPPVEPPSVPVQVAPAAVAEEDPVVDPGEATDPGAAPTPAPAPTKSTEMAPETPVPSADVAQVPAAPPAPAPAPVVEVPAAPPAVTVPVATTTIPAKPAARAKLKAKRPAKVTRRHATRRVRVAPKVQVAAAAPVVTSVAAPTQTVPLPARLRAHRGDRTHTVRPGESLWLIASDLLGANASDRAIARKVQRLWVLNADRIGTGDPSLLLVGTNLTLR